LAKEYPRMSDPAASWRDLIKVHPAADLFPTMSDDELDGLGEKPPKPFVVPRNWL
jgi:hypothetical protein